MKPLNLEKLTDDRSREMLEKAGEKEVEFFRWRKKGKKIQVTKSVNFEGILIVSIFGETGYYLPSFEEIGAIKRHFFQDKRASITVNSMMNEQDDLVVPFAVHLCEIPEPKESPIIQTRKPHIITSPLIN